LGARQGARRSSGSPTRTARIVAEKVLKRSRYACVEKGAFELRHDEDVFGAAERCREEYVSDERVSVQNARSDPYAAPSLLVEAYDAVAG
jgi:hypothetical protein